MLSCTHTLIHTKFRSPYAPSTRPTDGQNSTPFSKMSGQLRDTAYAAGVQHADATAAAKGADPFQAPVNLDPKSMHLASNGARIPYDYDRQSYSWLKGKVDYDAGDNSWHIIYNPRPDAADKLGGGIRLLDDKHLRELHDQDIVKIEGEVDYDHPDPSGKPQYRVVGLGRYKPKPVEPSAN